MFVYPHVYVLRPEAGPSAVVSPTMWVLGTKQGAMVHTSMGFLWGRCTGFDPHLFNGESIQLANCVTLGSSQPSLGFPTPAAALCVAEGVSTCRAESRPGCGDV